MESVNAMDLNLLLNVLAHGEEQARFLEASLTGSKSAEHCKQIQNTFKKAISVAEFIKSAGARQVAFPNNTTNAQESPRSNTGSPRSEDSERLICKENERREMCKKRKTMPTWTRQVCILPSEEEDDSLKDGFSWRKYGQKDILRAKHPRGYYRCTYKNTLGCLATKQMQKCDDNPSVFDITYRGEHTCLQKSKQAAILAPIPNEQTMQQKQHNTPSLIIQEKPHNSHNQELLLNFQKKLKLETEGLDKQEQQTPSSFYFPSTPISIFTKPENHFISTSSTPENSFVSCFSPSFFSPATTTGSNYLSLSACGMNNYVAATPAANTSESAFTDIISTHTLMANSPLVEFGNILDIAEFDYDAINLDQ